VKPAIPRTTTLTRTLIPAMQSGTAYAHFFAGCYDEASVWAAKALHEFPSFLAAARVAAASTMLPVGANVRRYSWAMASSLWPIEVRC
jgi:hypothetical protein